MTNGKNSEKWEEENATEKTFVEKKIVEWAQLSHIRRCVLTNLE